jgi:NAD(P)-dependent dehydrogenase (short-subunit alcohol dehydrogenase family)
MKQRTLLVTGASSGIGLASARLMKARGWRVLATARNEADLARLEGEEGVEALRLDLADLASVAACAAEALKRTEGRLFGLFNNAAFGQVGAVEDLSADILRRQIEVNVIATHELTRLVLPAMRRQGEGRIVQCSSVLGLISAPYRGAYCASKFALEALSDALRLELAGSGIRVSIIEPGRSARASSKRHWQTSARR